MPDTNAHAERERVALYLRVSSEEQRDRETITIQREFLESYRDLYGLDVVEVYADDGISGTIPLHERPAGTRLLEDARAGRFDTVLLYKLDRLGRTLLAIVDAHDRLHTAGVELRSATEPIDTSSPSGRLIFNMLAGFAQYDRENIADRTTKGLHKAFRNGKQTGFLPYGYSIDESGAFVIVEDEARIVAQIIEGVADGSTCYAEARRLNDEGTPSPGHRYRGRDRLHGASWSATTINNIIHQRAYSGTHTVSLSSGETVERAVPAIVEPALQRRALSRLGQNKRYSGGQKGRGYLLTGMVSCGTCGSACVGHSSTARGKKNHYYVCSDGRAERPRKGEKGHAPFVSAPWLESMIWDDVKRFLENPGEVLRRVREQMEGDDATTELEERRADLTKRLAAKSAEKDRYVRAYAQGHISEEELADYVSDLRAQIDNLRLLIGAVEDDLASTRENAALAETTEAWLLMLRERISEVEGDTPEAYTKRRELVKLLVERITTDRDAHGRTRVEVRYRFGPPETSPDDHAGEYVSGETKSREFGSRYTNTPTLTVALVR